MLVKNATAIRPRRNNIFARWLPVLSCLVIVVAVVWFIRGLDTDRLLGALARTRVGFLTTACLLAVAQLVGRAAVFRTLMLPVARLPWMRVQRFTLAAATATALFPGRAGEVMRAYLLKRDDQVAVSATAAVTAVEKAVELLALALVLAPVPFLLPHLPTWARRAPLIAAGIALAVLALAMVIANHPPRWLARFGAALEIVKRPSLLGMALATAVGSWLIDFACLLAVMQAVGVAAPAASGLLVLLAVNLAIAVPLVPGNLGAFELGAVVGLQSFGVSHELGLAVGLLYHMAQVVPVALLALLDKGLVRTND